MQEEKSQKHLTEEEITQLVSSARKPGLRFTVDLYLLDYIKHCFLEDDQLNDNMQKLQTALDHLENTEVKKGVEDVLKSLQCVKQEYNEYQEDMRLLANGDYPSPKGAA